MSDKITPTEALQEIIKNCKLINNSRHGLDGALGRIQQIAGDALHPSESAGASAVWVKSQYDQLYEQVKTGKRTVCYIDYHAHGVDKVYRDICTIRPDVLEFSSRGVGYGCAQYMDGDEKTNFIQFCEKMNVEWLRESPSLAPDQSGKEDAVIRIDDNDLFHLIEKIINGQYASDPMDDMVKKMALVKEFIIQQQNK